MFSVGIDLGTTNCALAFADTREAHPVVHTFSIAQLVAPGEVEERETLPAFHYEAAPGEFGPEALRLPWETAGEATGAHPHFVGIFAREHGAAVPGRLIVSAKSWLCHAGVDRTAALLPWHGAPEVEKLSPVDVSARFLGHLRTAWNTRFPEHPLEAQEVVLTIPASFDEVARELTMAAARRVSLGNVVLLEEPQAAFYAWVHAHSTTWKDTLRPGQKILVCDVGGGTSDFTWIEVRPTATPGEARFHRVAVGDHLILGGDNLDLALAHFIETRLQTRGEKPLESRQWSVLVRRCQFAKELALSEDAPETFSVSIPAAGARLIGGALQIELRREEVRALLLDGFLPRVGFEEEPARRSSGFQEFGLPFAPDPAISRYLAAFLKQHLPTGEEGRMAARPDVVLFNGGLFESALMRERLLEIIGAWFADDAGRPWKPLVLENARLPMAVAWGAAHYGLVRRGLGTRIVGGLARSYYIGIHTAAGTNAALCLVPAGLEEAQEIHLEALTFDLRLREPAEFPLYVSSVRPRDLPGALVSLNAQEWTPLPPIRTALRSRADERATVPVTLHARLSEIGTLEVWCAEKAGKRKWRLQFDIRATSRESADAQAAPGATFDEDTLQGCAALIAEAFGGSPALAESLLKRMEMLTSASGLGLRWDWPPSFLRRLWETLLPLDPTRSPMHEARWLNLLGFALRPGYGFPVDDWRVAETWRRLTGAGPGPHSRHELCRAETCVLWRRLAGGLTAGQQKTLADPIVALLRKTHGRGDAHWGSHERAEIWRMLGAFELLEVSVKVNLGDWLAGQLEAHVSGNRRALLWTLGRLGARVPQSGPLNTVVPADTVERWINALLRLPDEPATENERHFALTQMARFTGDRYRELSPECRQKVLHALSDAAPPALLELVKTGGALDQNAQTQAFGEALPRGLRLLL